MQFAFATRLEKLFCNQGRMTDASIKLICEKIPNLRTICLNECSGVSIRGLQELVIKYSKKLRVVDLSDCAGDYYSFIIFLMH